MNYLIIEDERLGMAELKRMLTKLRPDYECAGWCESVEKATEWLKNNSGKADVVFADIRLTDGISFDVLENADYNVPVIFTTAYDEYAIRAFKVNGIDYLLKPIDEEELLRALQKLEKQEATNQKEYEATQKHRTRILVSVADKYLPLAVNDIAFFRSEDGYTFAHTFSGQKHIMDASLDSLMLTLDPERFFRMSRGYVCNFDAVESVAKFFGGRLKVNTHPVAPEPVIVSRERASGLIKWLDGR